MNELDLETRRSLMENAPSIILIVDQKGVIQHINRTVPGLAVAEVDREPFVPVVGALHEAKSCLDVAQP